MKSLTKRTVDFIILFLSCFTGIILCFFIGKDSGWDLANYHVYGPWALLTGRIGYDILPCSFQSYINPLIDFPLYFMIKYFNNHPYFIEAIQSLWWGFSVFFVYKISSLIFKSESKKLNIFYIISSVIIGATSVISIFEVGMSCDDLITSTFVLGALYLYLKDFYLEEGKERGLIILLVSLIFGLATGLKVTGAIFFVAFFFMHCFLLLQNKHNPLKHIGLIIIGFFAGFSVTGLWWYILIYNKFGNPFFPQMNHIFKAPGALPVSHADFRHYPLTLMQWLFYPFYWVFGYDNRHYVHFVIEAYNIDYRPVFVYITSVIFMMKQFFSKFSKQERVKEDYEKITGYIVIYTVFVYVMWLNTSSILRYIAPLEMLFGVLIFSVIYIFFKNKAKIGVIITLVLSIFMLFSTKYINNEEGAYRVPFGNKFIEVTPNNFPDNAVLCTLGGHPYNMFMPFENKNTKLVYIFGETESYYFRYPVSEENRIKEIINNPDNEIYAIYSDADTIFLDLAYVDKFLDIRTNPERWECKNIPNEFNDSYVLCKRLKR
ncbi:hypothetical protein IKQ26_08100 [bacterium]|nr:hypothetical protein [bacterium]